MEKTQKKNRVLLIGAIVLAVLVVAASLVYFINRPETTQGDKEITVQILYDSVSKTVEIQTDAEYLRGALEEKNLIQGDESEYGLFVKAVDGRTVDDSKQEWWCFTKDGEMLMTGVDTTPIADGEAYEVTLTEGY